MGILVFVNVGYQILLGLRKPFTSTRKSLVTMIIVVNHMHLFPRKYVCMHVSTKKESKYALICLTMHEYAFIPKHYLQIFIHILPLECHENQTRYSDLKYLLIYNITKSLTNTMNNLSFSTNRIFTIFIKLFLFFLLVFRIFLY